MCVFSGGGVFEGGCWRLVVGGGGSSGTHSFPSFFCHLGLSDRVPVVGTHRTGSQVSKCPVWLKGYSPAEQRLWWVGEESGRVGWESE